MAGLGRYRALLTLPGARWPVVASAVGSLPIGMYILGIVLLAREATGSFADAGRVAAAFGLANAVGAVAQGRLMDRLGQPRVLRTAAAAHIVAVAGLVVAAREGAPTWALALCATAGGASLPQVPAAMRSLWGTLVSDPEQRATAYALVSIVFEVAVVTAPALVAVIAAAASPELAVLIAAVLAFGGAVGFSATAGSRGWRGERHEVGWLGPLAAPGMQTVFVVLGAFGAAMGVLQVALPAFGAERGSAEEGGLLLAALSGGSLAGGLIYGSRPWPGSLTLRLVVLMLALGAGCALLAIAGSYATLALLLFVCGLLVAPVAVVASTLLDTVAPPGTATEAFAVMIMGIVAGNAAGNALAGAVVDGASYEAAVLCAAGLAALGAAITVALRRSLLRPSA
jgi:MFS family permease